MKITNDNYSNDWNKGHVGVPQVRLGGGLFFDYPNFNAVTKKKIGSGIFGDANFASLNDNIPLKDTFPIDDQMAKRSAPLTNKEDDLSNFAFNGDDENGTFNWNLDNTQASKYDEDQIVNKSDFNLTPNIERYIKNKQVKTIVSPEKKLFRDIVNKELFDWYWTTWSKEYDDRTTAEYNLTNAQRWQKDLIESKLDQSIKLDLTFAWNQLMNETLNSAFDTYANIIFGLGLDAASDEILTTTPWLYGWTAGEIISLLYPGTYTKLVMQHNLKNYFSPSLNQTFWYNLFNQYLGTRTSKSGLINFYYQKYKVLPENVHLNNFDFYMPFKNMNIASKMKHKTTTDPAGYDQWSYDTNTDFSKFNNKANCKIYLDT